MKKLLTILLLFYCYLVNAQFNPSGHVVINDALGQAQAAPIDGRTMYFDATNFVWRAFQDTTEVFQTLNLSKYRFGNQIIIVDSGGTLNSNGTYTNGHNTFWMFADGQANSNLIKLNLTGASSGSCSGCLLAANNLSDVQSASTSRTNLGLGSMAVLSSTAAGDLSGTWPNITVAKFNGLTPTYYLNYNNLSNTPSIPAQFNPIAGSGITLSGTYPNITFSTSGSGSGFNTAGTYLISSAGGTTINLDTANYRRVDSLWSLNDSTVLYTINGGVPDTLNIRGGTGSGGGGGSGTVTNVSIVSANGISGTVANPTSTPAITLTLGDITPTTVNGLTFTSLSTGFTVSGGTTSKTLTVPLDATVSGTNTGDVTKSGQNYLTLVGQAITANAVDVSGTNITGVLKASAFPALTGDVTTSAGSLATTIANNVVTNAKAAQMAANTIKGNNTGSTANASDLTATQVTAMLNVFTTSLNGLVPFPTTSTGKVLSDAGTWVTNGTGNTNSNIGAFYRWAVPGTNNIKTFAAGYGTLIDSSTNTNALTIKVDTSVIAPIGIDSIFVTNVPSGGTGVSIIYASSDTIYGSKLLAGANITLTKNSDSSITITSTGGGGGGGISTVGTIDTQTPSSNGLVISGSSIYAQSASATAPGMVNTSSQTFAGVKTFSSAPMFSTLTTNGGVFFGNGSGVLQQTGAGTSTQVLHGGSSPTFSAVALATEVSGILAKANGGTGTASPALVAGTGITITGTWPNNTISASGGSVTSINASGGTTGMSFTGGPITSSGTLTFTGTLGVANGGSGLSSVAPYALFAGGSTPTGSFQQVSGTGTLGQVLVSSGSGALPTWQAGNYYNSISQTNDSTFTLNRPNGTADTVQIHIVATDDNIYNSDGTLTGDRELSGSGSSLSLGISSSKLAFANIYSAGIIGIYGIPTYSPFPIITDANYTANAYQATFKLPAITANRTFTPPSAGGNATLFIWNTNTSAFSWSPASTNFKDAAGNTISSFANSTFYYFMNDGTNWIQINNPSSSTSGTYTPTISATVNVASSTAGVCQYTRVGNIVTVTGRCSITPSFSGLGTNLHFSLPIASTLSTGDLNGTITEWVGATDTSAMTGPINEATTDNTANAGYNSIDASAHNYQFTFTYKVN